MQLAYTNGTKSYNAPMNDPSAWVTLGNLGYKEEAQLEMMAKVAVVRRVRELIATSVANIPFSIVNEAGDEIDISTDWQNVVGFLPRPKDLLRRWRMSVIDTNAGYGFFDGKRPGTPESTLRYIVPWTITPKTDASGLLGFERKLGTEKPIYYPLSSNRIVYLWWLDHTTELLPSDYTEADGILEAAGIMRQADRWICNYFAGGGVPPTVLGVKGVTTPTARAELEGNWDKFVKSIAKLRAKVINSEALEVKQIGGGIEALKDTDIYHQSMTNVCSVFGIPVSLIESDFANYSTAQTYYWAWYKDKVVPDCEQFAEQLNQQVFEPLGLYWRVNAESAEPNQAEEVERAQAFSTYVSAGIPMSIAAQIVGIDMPAGMSYDDLDAVEEEKKAEAEKQKQEQLDKMQQAQEEEPDQEDEPPVKFIPNPTQNNEIVLWRKFVIKHYDRDGKILSEWEAKYLPDDIVESVRERLKEAKSRDDIAAAFEFDKAVEQVDYSPLLKAIDAGIAALKFTQPQQPVVNNVTYSPPVVNVSQPAPVVNVSVPDQPAPVVNVAAAETKQMPAPIVNVAAPVVNVTNDVQPAPVTVMKQEPPDVIIKKQRDGSYTMKAED